MYNESRKNEYLQYKGQDYLKHLFIDAEQYELALGKDLCDMDTSEALHYLSRYDGYRTFEDKRRQMSNYAEWCVIKGYAAVNWISPKVVPGKNLREIYLSMKEEFYISQERFGEYRQKLLDSSYGAYIASVFCCIYEGIAGKGFFNLVHLRVQDIDKVKGTVNLQDAGEVHISPELIDLLLETAKVTEITNEKTVRYISSLYPDSIWKLRPNEAVTQAKVQRKFVYLIEEMKKILDEDRLSVTTISKSGYFNRIYHRVLEDGIDIRALEFGTDKKGREENARYQKYFEDSGLNMNMRKFKNAYQSYLNQL